MRTKKVLISGLPGNMATLVAKLIQESGDFELADIALTGSKAKQSEVEISGQVIKLLKPDERDQYLKSFKGFAIDYTVPDSYLENCNLFIKHQVPFVIGTTGPTMEQIAGITEQVEKSEISAVIDQNMSIELVMISSALHYLASTFPGILRGHAGYGTESHQNGKKDTISGTLQKWGGFIQDLGVDFTMLPGDRSSAYGHAYHNLRFFNDKGNVRVNIGTEVEGRDTYAQGTIFALNYLSKMLEVEKGKVYSMTDVLRGR